jgi:toxin HigB-1
MIKSFRHKGLQRLFETGKSRSVSADLTRRLIRQLDFLNRAMGPADMNLPGNRLHELKGDRKDTWSVTVSGNWRLTFAFEGEDARDVDLEDYH